MNWELLFDALSFAVWVGLAALALRAVMIVNEVWRRSDEFHLVGTKLFDPAQTILSSLRGLYDVQDKRRWQGKAIELTKGVGDSGFQSVLMATVLGQEQQAVDRLNQWVEEQVASLVPEIQYGILAQRLGLAGTVIGIGGGFVIGDGSSVPMSEFGFALLTTLAGLIVASAIDYSLENVFKRACTRLEITANQVRNDWSQVAMNQRWRFAREPKAEIPATPPAPVDSGTGDIPAATEPGTASVARTPHSSPVPANGSHAEVVNKNGRPHSDSSSMEPGTVFLPTRKVSWKKR